MHYQYYLLQQRSVVVRTTTCIRYIHPRELLQHKTAREREHANTSVCAQSLGHVERPGGEGGRMTKSEPKGALTVMRKGRMMRDGRM